MLPSFLISLREIIEASLIIATILGITTKLKQKKAVKSIWFAAIVASATSVVIIFLGSVVGLETRSLFTGNEPIIEGILLIISAGFISWAVLYLHKYFNGHKTRLLEKIRLTVEQGEQKGLFLLVFTVIFREGIEIALFLSTVYFSSNPKDILLGFIFGVVIAFLISFGLFTATVKLPVYYAFRITSILLILFAAGQLATGVHEFAEIGILPEIGKITLLNPENNTFMGEMIKAIFGLSQKIDLMQISIYSLYVLSMSWVVLKKDKKIR